VSSPTPVLSRPDAPAILLDHIRWAHAKGVSVNYASLSLALGCSTLEAKDALSEFWYCRAQAKRTDKETA
jgi:hypothetical protein